MAVKDKSFPFAYQAWLTATTVRNMTKEQRSDYLDLLCYLANEGDKGLKDDDVELCKLLQCPQSTLDVIKARLYVANGRLFNHRLNKSLLKKKSKKKKVVTDSSVKEAYGEARNIFMSVVEYKKLVHNYGEDLANKCIEHLSSYKINKPNYPINSAYHCILNWVIAAVIEKERKINGNSVNGNSINIPNGKAANLMQSHSATTDFINNSYPDVNENNHAIAE